MLRVSDIEVVEPAVGELTTLEAAKESEGRS